MVIRQPKRVASARGPAIEQFSVWNYSFMPSASLFQAETGFYDSIISEQIHGIMTCWIRNKWKDLKTRYTYEKRLNSFFILDTLFLGCGLGTIAIGIWLYVDRNTFIELTPTSYSAFSAAGLCCFTGATICIISIVGIIGIWLRNTTLLKTFIAFVLLLAFLQAFTGVVGLIHKEGASEFVRNDLLKNINNTYVFSASGRKMELSYSWGQLQSTLQCCGVDGPEDWYYSIYFPKNEFVLDTCCDPNYFANREAMINCGKMSLEERKDYIYKRGCYTVFVNWLFHHIRVVNFMSITLIIIELFTTTTAFFSYLAFAYVAEKPERATRGRMLNRLREINEREQFELQLTPLDRIGDANWTEHEDADRPEDKVPEGP